MIYIEDRIASGERALAFHSVRWGLGGLLVITALLKTIYTLQTEGLVLIYGIPRWVTIFVVQAELFVGLLLLFGCTPRLSWLAAVSLFSLFGLFSLYRLLAGYESCGCFGPIKVSPWISFAIDLVALILLVGYRKPFSCSAQVKNRRLVYSCGAIYVICGGLSLVFMSQTYAAPHNQGVTAFEDGKVAILEPVKWSGRKFPLAREVSPTLALAKGDWLVLLFHHDCPECNKILPRFLSLAQNKNVDPSSSQFALIEIPPYGEALCELDGVVTSRLTDMREWIVQTPIVLQIKDGIVVRVSDDLPSNTNAERTGA